MKKIIETLKTQVQILKESKDDMNAASWNYEEGVIITGNQAQKIIDELSRSSAGDYSTGSVTIGENGYENNKI